MDVNSDQLINLEEIKFLFVGRDFIRKGGLDTVIAMQSLRKKYRNFRLTIVSQLDPGSYGFDDTDLASFEEIKKFLFNTEWITLYSELPNDEVLELMKNSDVGLLPTRADTYGFSILEMQAAGTPVITTDVRAIPEINTNETGWIIEVPKNNIGEAKYQTKDDLKQLRKIIRDELTIIIEDILVNTETIRPRRQASLKRILKDHNPQNYEKIIEKIYDRGRL